MSTTEEWFVMQDGSQYGPATLAALRGWFQDGSLRADAQVWREGMPAWLSAAECPEVRDALAATPPRTPPQAPPLAAAAVARAATRSFELPGWLKPALMVSLAVVVVGSGWWLGRGDRLAKRVTGIYNTGTQALENGRPADAIPSFDQALALDGRHLPSYLNRGAARLDLGDTVAALADFERVTGDTGSVRTKYGESLRKAYYNIGVVQQRRGRWTEALANFKAAEGIYAPRTAGDTVNLTVLVDQISRYLADSARARRPR